MMVFMQHIPARLSLAALALLAACDVPTGLPIYDTVWNVPGKNTSISVNSFLPSGVTVAANNTAFQVTASPATSTITRQLGQDCAACTVANGQTTPKPAFSGGGTASVTLPSNVASAVLVNDTLTVTITNSFNFDPIKPSAGARGYFTISVKSGATTIGRDSLDGATSSMPAGGIVTRKIALSGIVSGTSGLQIATNLNSPLGDPVVIDVSRAISVSGSTGVLLIASAQVNLSGQSVVSSGTDLDLSSIGESVSKHADGGSLLLTVVNPFTATGNLSVTFTGGPSPIVKSVALGAGTTTPSITFTQTELGGLFGHDLAVSFNGTVAGSGVTVQPGQVVSVSSRLQVNISTKSE